jgi:hypothetical protein
LKRSNFRTQQRALFLSISVIAFDRIRTHSHWTWTRRLKTRSSFTLREVSPAFRFTKPHPTVLSIKRGAAAAQQFHVTTAY